MINLLVTSIIINTLINERLDKIDYQFHNIGEEIYLLLPQDELDFLCNNTPGFIINWLIKEHGNEFNERIEKKITDSIISLIQNKYKIQSINDITLKQLLVFAYVTQIITKKHDGLENAALLVISYHKMLDSINTSPKMITDNSYYNIIIEKELTTQLDAMSKEIMFTLSEKEKKYLLGVDDTFILVWIFTNKWARPLLEQREEFQEKFVDELFINDEMLKYLIRRYKLNIIWVNEFKVFLTGAYFAGKLKNHSSNLETSLQIFLTYQYMTMPKLESDLAEKISSKPILETDLIDGLP
jgi:hypothetical protein